ncbi:hypothetical protein [Pseudomonas viridiflava]
MPLIQIEQDSPEVIERARERIAKSAASIDGEYTEYVAEMHAQGYIAALSRERLISPDVQALLFKELAASIAEAERARKAARAG